MMRDSRDVIVVLGMFVVLSSNAATSAGEGPRDERSPSVGMSARIEQIVLPGSELVAKPIEDSSSPVILRIVASYPHGDAFRYDMVYYGLDPGSYDLRDYLQRADGSSLDGVEPIRIEVNAVLPPGQVEPNALTAGEHPSLGGYRTLAIVLGVNWVLGLLLILFLRRRRRAGDIEAAEESLSLADRLRPYVNDAIAGKLTQNQLAKLERMLLAHWRGRLGLEQVDAAEAIQALKQHAQAGALLNQLELWLHRPGTHDEVDVAELLEPYRDVADGGPSQGAIRREAVVSQDAAPSESVAR